MTDLEKFGDLKRYLIYQNEDKYGSEIRKKYGADRVEASYNKICKMSQEDWDKAQEMSGEINRLLGQAIELGDPASPIAQTMCDLHRQWLCFFWPEVTYHRGAHLALADDRFLPYYDAVGPEATQFLCDALHIYCQEEFGGKDGF